MRDFDVLVPFRTDDGPRQEIWDWVLQRWVHLFSNAHVILSDSDPTKPFNRSQARNNAFKESTARMVVFADADVIPMPEFVEAAVKSAQFTPTLAYGEERYYNLTQEATPGILSSDPASDFSEPTEWEFNVTSWASMIAMNRKCFMQTGGYDEGFSNWGFEDSAFASVIKAAFGGFNRVNGFISHVWHPYTQETTWENPHFKDNQARYMQSYRPYENNEHAMRESQNRLGSRVF